MMCVLISGGSIAGLTLAFIGLLLRQFGAESLLRARELRPRCGAEDSMAAKKLPVQ